MKWQRRMAVWAIPVTWPASSPLRTREVPPGSRINFATKQHPFGCSCRSCGIPSRMEWTALPRNDSAAQVSGAATRLEQAWKRWRSIRGLPDGADPIAAYVGYSPYDQLGQAQVVIEVGVADALLITEMITYLVASRPLGRTGASSEPRPSAGHRNAGQECHGQVASHLSAREFSVPSPDVAEAERPIMRSSAPARASLSMRITQLGGGSKRRPAAQTADSPVKATVLGRGSNRSIRVATT